MPDGMPLYADTRVVQTSFHNITQYMTGLNTDHQHTIGDVNTLRQEFRQCQPILFSSGKALLILWMNILLLFRCVSSPSTLPQLRIPPYARPTASNASSSASPLTLSHSEWDLLRDDALAATLP